MPHKGKVAHAEILTSTPYNTELSAARMHCIHGTSKITNKRSAKKKLNSWTIARRQPM